MIRGLFAMRAMRLEKIGRIDDEPLVLREDVQKPEPKAGEVRVKVHCCAVCRTDLHVVEGDLPKRALPVTPGHQVVGTVDKLGAGCERYAVGDRVGIAWLRHVDGTCLYCRRGWENLCDGARFTGYDVDGGYGEYAVVREDFAYAIPQGFENDAVASPLLCAGLIGYRALERAAVPEGGRLLLVGFGSSAHIVIQLALHRGYEAVVLTRSESHQRLALEMGASWAGDDIEQLPEAVDSAIIFAPVGGLVPPVLGSLRKGGTVSLAGIHMSPIPEIDYDRDLYYERQIRSVTANTRADARALLREAVEAQVQPQVTTYDLADANRALADMKHSRIDGSAVLMVR